jgi:hypothetical protein
MQIRMARPSLGHFLKEFIMARHTSSFSHSGFESKPPARSRMRVAAFWSIVGIVVTAAVLSVSLDTSLRSSPASTAAATSLALPQPASFIPLTGEVEFIDRFAAEKRSAKAEELPSQF